MPAARTALSAARWLALVVPLVDVALVTCGGELGRQAGAREGDTSSSLTVVDRV